MKTIVDYVSFSIPVLRCEDGDEGSWWYDVTHELFAMPEIQMLFPDTLQWKAGSAMKPYNRAWHRSDEGVVIHGNPNMPHITVQVSGGGCAALRASYEFQGFLETVIERLTRIDIATDVETACSTKEIADARHKGRFKSGGEKFSPTGVTQYIGSRESEKFLRIYSYNAPHPRAGTVRYEFELKRAHAKSAARGILSEGVEVVADVLGKQFGLLHHTWRPLDGNDLDIRPDTPERRGTPKLTWLNTQVAPTIKRLHNEGAFDARAWVDQILDS